MIIILDIVFLDRLFIAFLYTCILYILERRDKDYNGTYLREDTMQLYAVRQQSTKPDQIYIFDLHDNGSLITTEDLDFFVRNIRFVGENR